VGGDKNEAKRIADNFIQTDPPQGHFLYGMYYWISENDINKATTELKNALNLEIEDEELLREIRMTSTGLANRWGYKFLNEKNFQKAYLNFAWAIQIAPERVNPYDSMGDYYTKIAKYDSALWFYEKALSINPDFSASLFNKAITLEKLDKIDDSIEIYNQLINRTKSDRYTESAKQRLTQIRGNE
jgi:tetratricopeptide (TPR) repeat protein